MPMNDGQGEQSVYVWWELAPPCMIETFTTATETMVPNSSSSNSRDDRQLNIRTSSSSSTFPIS